MYKNFAKELGNTVRLKREELGISQEELAFRANVSRGYIGMIERAERALSLKVLFQISRALNLDFKELFSFDSLQKFTFKKNNI